MPSKQDAVQGRFKLAHCPISPGTRVKKGPVRRFEMPTALSDGRAWQKKTSQCSLRSVKYTHSVLGKGQERYLFKELKCYPVVTKPSVKPYLIQSWWIHGCFG